jgi:hypothetical protein
VPTSDPPIQRRPMRGDRHSGHDLKGSNQGRGEMEATAPGTTGHEYTEVKRRVSLSQGQTANRIHHPVLLASRTSHSVVPELPRPIPKRLASRAGVALFLVLRGGLASVPCCSSPFLAASRSMVPLSDGTAKYRELRSQLSADDTPRLIQSLPNCADHHTAARVSIWLDVCRRGKPTSRRGESASCGRRRSYSAGGC